MDKTYVFDNNDAGRELLMNAIQGNAKCYLSTCFTSAL